jgi:hypothetical protein
MDEIFSLHEHRHLITFNGHRILLVFLVNLWNPEYTKIIRHFYYIIYSSPGQEHFLRLRLDKNTLIIRNRQTLRALYVGVLFQIYIPSGLTSVSGQIELPHKFITCSLEAATRTSTGCGNTRSSRSSAAYHPPESYHTAYYNSHSRTANSVRSSPPECSR